MSIVHLVGAAVSVVLFAYLLVAMMKPEKF